MNFLNRKLVDLWQALVAWYFGWRFGSVARRLDGPGDESGRGLLIVQIDGLSHAHLLGAVTKGYAPYIRRLLRLGEGEAFRWFCGVPSTTPVVQAGIMFGASHLVPGFRWYDKASGKAVVSSSPRAMRALQSQIAAEHEGILRGGSSYANMLDGLAATSLFTLTTIGRTSLIEKIRGLGVFLVLLFSPIRILRILGLSLWTYLIGVWRRLAAVFWPSKFGRLSFLSPFVQVITDVLVREIQTFAVLVDVYRGVPSIYVNYTTYDEWAHRFGPSDDYAYRAVRAIDSRIKEIDRMRRRHAGREYDLFILSDHGMAPSVSFEAVSGCSLGQMISDAVAKPVLTNEVFSMAYGHRSAPALLGEEIAAAESRMPNSASGLARRVRDYLQRRSETEPLELAVSVDTDIVIRNSGPLCHVYFNDVARRMLAEEIELVHHGLIEWLAQRPGIGAVGALSAEGPIVVTAHGVYACVVGKGEAAFRGLPDADKIVGSFGRLLAQEHAGDLVVLGAWDWWGVHDLVVTFERQAGTHGGVGGQQCDAFILPVGSDDYDFSDCNAPEDLYRFFLNYSKRLGEPEVAGEVLSTRAGVDKMPRVS